MGTHEQKPGTGEAGAASPIMRREARYREGVRSFHPRSQRQWQGRDSARACLSPGPGATPALPPLVTTLRPSLRPRHLSPSVCGPTPTGPSSVCKDAPSPGSSLTSSGQWHVPPSCSAPAWPPEWAVKPPDLRGSTAMSSFPVTWRDHLGSPALLQGPDGPSSLYPECSEPWQRATRAASRAQHGRAHEAELVLSAHVLLSQSKPPGHTGL